MKKIILSISAFLAFLTHSNAQDPSLDWVSVYGGGTGNEYNIGSSITTDAAGNVYTFGSFQGTVDFDPSAGVLNLTSAGQSDIFIQKIDANGNFVWAKSIGGTVNEIAKSITVDASGNVYTTGSFSGTVDFDPNAGTHALTSNGGGDVFVQKLDTDGDFIWAKSVGGTGTNYDMGNALDIDASGNVYTTGVYRGTVDFDPDAGVFDLTSEGNDDIFIQKLDSNGDFVWAKSMGGSNIDSGNSIVVDGSGDIYTVGSFIGSVDFDPNAGTTNLSGGTSVNSFFMQKLSASGNLIWAKHVSGMFSCSAYSITIDDSGNIYTTGEFAGTVDFNPDAGSSLLTGAGGYDIFVQKLNSSGNFVWAKSIGGTSNDKGFSIAVDADENVYSTGHYRGTVDFNPSGASYNLTAEGGSDIYIQKLDANGNFVWTKSMGGTSGDEGSSIAVDVSNNVYTIGSFRNTVDFDPDAGVNSATATGFQDVFVQKLKPCPNTGVDVQVACGPYTWIDGITYSSSNNTATHTLTNVSLCDSVVTLDLTVNSPNTGVDVQVACGPYTWIDGVTYSNSNNSATHTLTNVASCDSVVTLDLTINSPNTGVDVQVACESYTWIDGVTYTNSNNSATHTLTNVAGCDSVVTLNLTIEVNNINVQTVLSGTTISAINTTASSYQWIDCFDNSVIVGENNLSFAITTNGNYAVIINEGACSDTSDCVLIEDLGISQTKINNITIYPNPVKNVLFVELDNIQFSKINIIDLSGKTIMSVTDNNNGINVSELEPGIYILKVYSEIGISGIQFVVHN